RRLDRQALVADERRDLVGGHGAHEIFALARARDRARAVVGVRAGPDDRRVAHTPGALVRHAAGGGGGGEMSGLVEGHGTDGAVDVVGLARVADLARLGLLLLLLELLPATLG